MTWGRRLQAPGLILTKRWTWPRDLQLQPMRAGLTWVTLVVARDGFLPRRPSQRLHRLAHHGAECRKRRVTRAWAEPFADACRGHAGVQWIQALMR